MASNVEDIVEILGEMKIDGAKNNDILRAAFDEFKKSIEEKHTFAINKFHELEVSFENISKKQENLSKTNELKELFEIFQQNVNLINEDIKEQKSSLDDLSKILDKIYSEKPDKKDFEENVETLKDSIYAILEKFLAFDEFTKSSTEKIYDKLSELVTKDDNIELTAAIRELTQKTDNTIDALKFFNNKSENLASAIQNLIMSDDYIQSHESINKIFERTKEISSIIPMIPLKADVEKISKNFEGFSSNYSQKIEDLNTALQNCISTLSESVKSGKNDVQQDLIDKFTELQKAISLNSGLFEDKIENLKEKISKNIETITLINSEHTKKTDTSLTELSDIKNELLNIAQVLSQTNSASDKTLNTLTGNIDDNLKILSFNIDSIKNSIETCEKIPEIQTSLDSMLYRLNEVTTAIAEIKVAGNNSADLNNIIDLKLSSIKDTLHEIVGGLNEKLELKNTEIINDISKVIKNMAEISGICKTINPIFESKWNSIEENLNSNIELITQDLNSIKDVSSNIYENNAQKSDLEIGFKNISSRFDEIVSQLKNTTDLKTVLSENVEESFNKHFPNIISSLESIKIILENNNQSSEIKENFQSVSNRFDEIISSICTMQENFEKLNINFSEELQKNLDNTTNYLENNIFKITSEIEDVKNILNSNLQTSSLQAGIDSLSYRFDEVVSAIEKYKDNADEINKNIAEDLNEKINILKGEINLVNTDLIENFAEKSKQIEENVSELKEHLKEFLTFDFMTNFEELKNQIELLYMNVSSELSKKFDTNKNLISEIETSIQELHSKFNSFDEVTKNNIKNELKTLELSIENFYKNNEIHLLKSSNFIDNWENEIEKIRNLNEDTKATISTKLDGCCGDLKSYIEENDKSEKIINILNSSSENVLNGISQTKDEILSSISETKNSIENTSSTLSTIQKNYENIDNSMLDVKLDFDDISEKIENLAKSDSSLAKTLEALHSKVDILAMDEDDDFDIESEIDDIKDLITNQINEFKVDTVNSSNSKIDECFNKLLEEMESINKDDIPNKEVKESIISAIISIFDQISFIEETEEIKDFVEEKTDEINEKLKEVHQQLEKIAQADSSDYTYTLQDVESDIAKLRLAMNEVTGTAPQQTLIELRDGIDKIVSSVENMQNSLSEDEIIDLKNDFVKLNEDMVSISSRTNKLLLTSDEAYKALSDGLDRFGGMIYKLEDKLQFPDTGEVNERIEKKVDALNIVVNNSIKNDEIFHQVLQYLGEWMDSVSESINSISEKTNEISSVKEITDELKFALPQKTELIEELEHRFETQELRIDRLEMKLDNILLAVEEKSDSIISKKLDKLEKQIAKLGINVEKLASYVDEE